MPHFLSQILITHFPHKEVNHHLESSKKSRIFNIVTYEKKNINVKQLKS